MSKSKFVVAALACAIGLSLTCNHQVPSECKQLCALPEEQQYVRFKSYAVEKQFELYAYCENEETCMRDSESPRDYYGQWMAQDDRAAPFLVERLKTERDENVQTRIIYVLRFMAVNGHLRGRYDVAEVANHAATNMKADLAERIFRDGWRVNQSKEWAKEIEEKTR